MNRRGHRPAVGGPPDRGSVTIVMACLFLLMGVLTAGVADLAIVMTARARAQTAADLAALAAAQELAIPIGEDPVRLAGDFAEANGALLVSCSCEEGSGQALVQVSVLAGPLILLGGSRPVHAVAKAAVRYPDADAATLSTASGGP